MADSYTLTVWRYGRAMNGKRPTLLSIEASTDIAALAAAEKGEVADGMVGILRDSGDRVVTRRYVAICGSVSDDRRSRTQLQHFFAADDHAARAVFLDIPAFSVNILYGPEGRIALNRGVRERLAH